MLCLVGVTRGNRRIPTSSLAEVRPEILAPACYRCFARPHQSWLDGGSAATGPGPSTPSTLPVHAGSARPTWMPDAGGCLPQWTSCHPEQVIEEYLGSMSLPAPAVLVVA